MPKISDLPTDTAPASTDLIPFVDVDAARTESVTVANLAASTAFAGQYEPLQLIETQTISGTDTSLTFSTIPTDFRDLEIVYFGKSTGSQDLTLRFNGDTSANYDWQRLLVSNTSVSGLESLAATSMAVGITGAVASSGRILIPSFQQTAYQHSVTASASAKLSAVAGGLTIRNFAGFWRTTGAITSITLIAGSTSPLTGSVFSLYGST